MLHNFAKIVLFSLYTKYSKEKSFNLSIQLFFVLTLSFLSLLLRMLRFRLSLLVFFIV